MIFASTVLVLHGIGFGGFSDRPARYFDLAAMAVDGFFVISGFLIVRSRLRCASTARYLWHRAVRIMPGFWACQLAVAFVFAPLGWLYVNDSLAGYFTADHHGPFSYVLRNITPRISFLDIAGTPTGVPFPPAGSGIPVLWNGNLWTLWWELLCYLGVAALAVVALLRRRVVAGLLAGLLAVLVLARIDPARAASALGPLFDTTYGRFGTLFLCGAVLSIYGDRIPCSRLLAAGSAVAVAVAYYDSGTSLRTLEHASVDYLLGALPLAYLCVWLGIRLPLRGFGNQADLSYGVYIYGSPVQQLAAVYGLHEYGVLVYLPATIAVTFLLAAGSWFAIEAPALRLRSWTPALLARLGRPGRLAAGTGQQVTAVTPMATPQQRIPPDVAGSPEPPVSVAHQTVSVQRVP